MTKSAALEKWIEDRRETYTSTARNMAFDQIDKHMNYTTLEYINSLENQWDSEKSTRVISYEKNKSSSFIEVWLCKLTTSKLMITWEILIITPKLVTDNW